MNAGATPARIIRCSACQIPLSAGVRCEEILGTLSYESLTALQP